MSKKYTFQDFLASVDGENQKFVSELHDKLMALGCKIDVKSAKSGYVVSYSLDKKIISNYVFRKKELIARIYAGHIAQYMLQGERLQRCRNSAFMFLPDKESRPYVESLLLHEIKTAV